MKEKSSKQLILTFSLLFLFIGRAFASGINSANPFEYCSSDEAVPYNETYTIYSNVEFDDISFETDISMLRAATPNPGDCICGIQGDSQECDAWILNPDNCPGNDPDNAINDNPVGDGTYLLILMALTYIISLQVIKRRKLQN
ncbi:MAG: hypothetical protein LBR52_05900 [Prevotellaceae bacterium]|jgi:hypothetical protein|nr:hypothetical protein [Prevotellaceae bacterium]